MSMSNHESNIHLASVAEASRQEAGLSRPPVSTQERSRALQMLKVLREHPKTSAAVVLALLGQHFGLARPLEPALAQHTDTRTTLHLPITGNAVDFHRLPQPQPIIPTSTRTSGPSSTPVPSETPTPAELPPTPEIKIRVGLSDKTVGGWDKALDPYERQHSLAQVGLRSYDDNLIDFDTEGEGTGVIRAPGGAPVAYRLKLAEPGSSEPHFFEVSFSTLAELVEPAQLQKLLLKDYVPAADSEGNAIKITIAHDTRLYDAANGSGELPLAEADQAVDADQTPLEILGGKLIPVTLEQTHSLTDQVIDAQENPANSEALDSEAPDAEKVYGNLKPVASIAGVTGAATWHTFVRGVQELPKDSGFDMTFNGKFEGFGVVHLSYWLPNQTEGATGMAVAVTDQELFFINYDQGKVDGPYTFDLAVAPGNINVTMRFKDAARKHVEVAVVDAAGKTTYFNITLRYPIDQLNVVNVNAAYSASRRGDATVAHVGLDIPVNRDRLLNVSTDTDLQRLAEFNTLRNGLRPNIAVPRFSHLAQTDDTPYDPLLDQAAALFVDRSPTHTKNGSTIFDDELQQTSNPMIALRPYRNDELRAIIRERRKERPEFFAALAYDVRPIALNDAGYTTSDFEDDLKKWHEGAERAPGLMVDAPVGVLGKSGGVGDFVGRFSPPPGQVETRARKVAEVFVNSMPEGTTWDALLQLDPGMLMGQTQMDALIATLDAMNSVDRTDIKGVIATAFPDYSMNRSTYKGYLLSLKGRLNERGYILHLRDADIGLLTPEDVDEILKGQPEGVDGLAMLGDPRNEQHIHPSATPLLSYDEDARTLEYTEAYTSGAPVPMLTVGAGY